MDLGTVSQIIEPLASTTLELSQMPQIEPNAPVLRIIGKAPLSGHVPISGAKNSILALMAGTLLSSEGCRIRNVPKLADVERMSDILETLGVKISRTDEVLDLDTSNLTTNSAPYELVSKMRASFFALGSLLARLGSAKMPLPGGCAIGNSGEVSKMEPIDTINDDGICTSTMNFGSHCNAKIRQIDHFRFLGSIFNNRLTFS